MRNKRMWRHLIAATLVIAMMGVFTGCGSNEPQKVEKEAEEEVKEEKAEEPTVFGVGETAELNDVQVTLQGYTESAGDEFSAPEAGNIYVLVQFDIANNSSETLNVSSVLSFEAYVDDYAVDSSLMALSQKGELGQLDGEVAPGKKMNGVVGYEVSADWAEMEINFKNDVMSKDTILFKVVK